MPGTDRTIVSDATFSQSSRTSSAGAVSRKDSCRTHVRVVRSTVTVSTMSSRDSRRSPPTERAARGLGLVAGFFLGSSRAPAVSSPSSESSPSPSSSSEPEPEPEAESEAESESESESSSMASPTPSSEALTSPSVLTVFTCANFSLFSFASASVKPSPSSPRASLRSSALAPSSSSSSSSSEASSPSSLSSFFDLTAFSGSSSSPPPSPPRAMPKASKKSSSSKNCCVM
mmetsp:Transcript_10588/g.47745  ORF Transcript_10588/g.47745 Transcript_10588/m.47745 type:complete len:230 (+) Transcript_10588:634-1323(+)